MDEKDLERIIALVEHKFLTQKMQTCEDRQMMLLALLFESLSGKEVNKTKQIIFKAFMIGYTKPSKLEIENAKKYINSVGKDL